MKICTLDKHTLHSTSSYTPINPFNPCLPPPPQAVFEEIQSHKPDVVRQTVRENYRYDENILPSKPPPERKIIVPTSGAAEVIYANGEAMCVCVCVCVCVFT